MSCYASTAGWNAGNQAGWNAGQQSGSQTGAHRHRCGGPRRGLEIAGIILGFIFVWPLALAYVIWKLMGYPVPREARAFFEKNFTSFWESGFKARPAYSSTGNFAFEEYRKRELERLEEERRRLEEEAHHFAEFVEELKRAKDREEFESFMAKRRGGTATA
jgi:Protein of unknown function (DUF2852)